MDTSSTRYHTDQSRLHQPVLLPEGLRLMVSTLLMVTCLQTVAAQQSTTDRSNGSPRGVLEALGGATSPGRTPAGTTKLGVTSVFDVWADGTRFVYVFDRSESMNDLQRRPLRAAKREMWESIRRLNAAHQFQIVFYNHEPQAFQPTAGPPRAVWAEEDAKRQAKAFIGRIKAFGGTRHVRALTLGLRMNPDAVFFLTDAQDPRLSDDDLARIRELNPGAVIHAIEFGIGAAPQADNYLTRLAAQNGGEYKYVDVHSLPD